MIQKLETWVKKEEVFKNCCENSREETPHQDVDSQKSTDEKNKFMTLGKKFS